MGICEAKRYTCEECVEGLDWVKAYMMDPIMISEYVIYLEQNFCLDEWENCKENVFKHFPSMHMMAMEKFMIPVEICNQEPVCGADPPTNRRYKSTHFSIMIILAQIRNQETTIFKTK